MIDKNECVAQREKLLNQLVDYFSAQSEVNGLFLGGSLAAGNADAFSDIDFRVLVSAEIDKSQFLTCFIKQIDKLAFIETQAENYAVLHFEHFIKLDFFIYHQQDLTPSIWTKNIKIIKDKDFLTELKKASEKLNFQLNQKEFDEYLNKFYAWYHELYRRWQRDENNYSEFCSLMLKNILSAFWLMEKGICPNSIGDWSKIEGSRSKLTQAEQAFLTENTPVVNIENFLKILLPTLLATIKLVQQHYQIEFDENKFLQLTVMISNNNFNQKGEK